MESDQNMETGNSSGHSNQANSRWNPTKEQISLLENMYKQGIRTPTADQIQQITTRLKAFGNIEGKNVFYWFQNHKARQRQKQKQENLAYLNRFLHHHHPIFSPPPPNVVCGSCYVPQSELGFYPQYPKVVLPSSGFKRRQRTEKMEKARSYGCPVYESASSHDCNDTNLVVEKNQETLPLFPLHPTGNLQEKEIMSVVSKNYSGLESINAIPSTSSQTISGVDQGSTYKTFFDFFSGQVLPFEN